MPTIYIKDYDTEVEIPEGADMTQVQKALATQFPPKTAKPQPSVEAPEWAGKYPNLYGAAGATRETLGPILEALGIAGGGVAGSVAGPAGTVAGAGLGYAGVKNLLETVDTLIGNTQAKTITEQAKELPGEVASGAAMEAGWQIAGKALSAVGGKAIEKLQNIATGSGGKLGPEVIARQQLAKKTGVDLSPAAIKGTKTLAQVESFLDKNITTSSTAQKAAEKTVKQAERFAKANLEGMGGKITAEEAGDRVQSFAKSRYGKFMQKAQKMYEAVPVDKQMLIETNNLRDTAIGISDELGKMGTPVSKRILSIAEESMLPQSMPGATGSPLGGEVPKLPSYTWKELVSDRNALNQMWRQTSDPNKKRLIGQLVDAIDDDIAEFSKLSPDVDKAFNRALKFYKFGDESLPGVRTFRDKQIRSMLNSSSPEDIATKFIKPDNVSDIRRIVSASGPEGTQALKQAWLGRLITRGEEGTFSPAKFATAFNKYTDSDLSAFLTKQEISSLRDLSKVSNLVTKAERIAGNPSGTAQNVLTGGVIFAAARHPVITASVLMGSKKFAKMYFESPEFRKNLITGMKFNPNSIQAKKYASIIENMVKSYGVAKSSTQQNKESL